METKICFRCKVEKPLSEFYKHPKMRDGHLNKCKECAKQDAICNYEKKANDKTWVEKERARGREKYRRLGYVEKYKSSHPSTKNVYKYISKRICIPKGYEIHHWDYNNSYDVFLLSRRAHKMVHKKIVFDKSTQMFLYNEKLLDTKDKHKSMIEEIFLSYGVTYDILEVNIDKK